MFPVEDLFSEADAIVKESSLDFTESVEKKLSYHRLVAEFWIGASIFLGFFLSIFLTAFVVANRESSLVLEGMELPVVLGLVTLAGIGGMQYVTHPLQESLTGGYRDTVVHQVRVYAMKLSVLTVSGLLCLKVVEVLLVDYATSIENTESLYPSAAMVMNDALFVSMLVLAVGGGLLAGIIEHASMKRRLGYILAFLSVAVVIGLL